MKENNMVGLEEVQNQEKNRMEVISPKVNLIYLEVEVFQEEVKNR